MPGRLDHRHRDYRGRRRTLVYIDDSFGVSVPGSMRGLSVWLEHEEGRVQRQLVDTPPRMAGLQLVWCWEGTAFAGARALTDELHAGIRFGRR